jgi:phage terminase small subunit
MNKLTIRQKKFVANKVDGKTNHAAYLQAGYAASNNDIARANSSKLLAKENIKLAITNALEAHGATPEFAVRRLKEIAEQDKEIGAARLASKDILELHGWQRGDRPQIQLDITNASFFNQARPNIES